MDSLRETVEIIWQQIWVDLFDENDFLIKTVGTIFWGLLCFILLNSIFLVVDMTGFPHWLHKYKIQDKKNSPVAYFLFYSLFVQFL